MSLNYTNDIDYTSNRYAEQTIHQPSTHSSPVFFSLRTKNSKRKGLRVSFVFFQKKYPPDGRLNEIVATVVELSDIWKPGPMDGIPPFVMNYICYKM